MTEFEEALTEYRAALEAASATATTDIELRMYRLYSADLEHAERLYHKSGDAKWCLPLLESARILHQTDVLAGKEVQALRAAFDRLLECCRRSLRDFQ